MADEAKRAPGDEAEAKSFPCSSDSSSSSSSSEEEEDDDDDFGEGGALATSFAAMDVGVRTGRRGSVMAAPLEVAPSWSPPEFRKTAEERAAIEAALRLNILFERLGDEEMAVMVGAMQAQSFEPATSIIRQGEDGDLFYILEEGVCDIFVEGVGRVMQVVGGDARNFFGELALLYNVPRAATVTTVTDVRCWALDRTTFKTIGMQATTAQRKLHGEFVAQVPLLATLSPIERLTLADALMPLTLSAAEEIVTEGEPGKCFYIIEAGELMVTKRGQAGEVSRRLGRGDYFGELALMHTERRRATVTAVRTSTVLALDRRTFKRLLGPLEHILKQNAELYDKIVAEGKDST